MNLNSEIPLPAQAIIGAVEAPDVARFEARFCGCKVRLRYLAQRLHALGPRPLLHFIDEIERGHPLRVHLEAFGRLDPDVVEALGASNLRPPVFVVDGGRRHERA